MQIADKRIYPPTFDCGVATSILSGQKESGDKHVIQSFDGGLLIGVIDGLGHGDDAAVVASMAAEVLRKYPSESVISLVKRCHQELKGTRGAVMSVGSINLLDETITWIGVGNVEAVLVRSDSLAIPLHEHILIRGGVIGYNLPLLQATILPIGAGDTLIFRTDGISSGFGDAFPPGDSAQKIADRICGKYAKGTDDALVVVARYRGSQK